MSIIGDLVTGGSFRWWPQSDGTEYDGTPMEEGNRHTRLVQSTWLVWTRNQARRTQQYYFSSLYGGTETASIMPMGIDPAAQQWAPQSLPYNIIRAGTDSLVAKVAKNRPIPMYLPVGGENRVQKRTRLLNQFVTGLFHKHKAYKIGYQATKDAALFGTGMILVQPDGKKVSIEKLYPWEVHVDPVDARYGEPRSLYLVRYIDKDILASRFPEYADHIEWAPVLDEAFYPIQDVFAVTNRCTVIEAWHLPSKPGKSKDGRHTICLLDCTLLDEQWDLPDFPIARVQKESPISGWWGLGLGDELSGFQDETSRMAERVEYAHKIVGGQVWLVPDGGGVLDTDFNDDIGTIVRYQGGPDQRPVCENPDPLNPQTYSYFKDLPTTAFGFSGISTMSAQASRPPGVTAALALQTLDDMETDRFSMFERAHEEFYVDLARHMLRCVRDIADKYGDFRVFAANKGQGREILWKRDVDLEEDSYVVQAWPTSLLPKTPAAKLQRVMELSSNQIFDRAQVLSLLEVPDTTAEERRLLAPRSAAESQIAHLLECENPRDPMNYIPPEKFQDLSYSMSRAQQEYCLLQSDAIDRGTISDPDVVARLANIAKYAAACHDMIKDAQDQAAAQAALAQAAPGMTAGAAPVLPPGPQPMPASPGPMGNLQASPMGMQPPMPPGQ